MTSEGINSKKQYAMEGDIIKLNESDYNKMLLLYPKLDLPMELMQLDMELLGMKNWWHAMHAKLNYRNKNSHGVSHERKQSLSERSFAATEKVFREFNQNGGAVLEQHDNLIRSQVGFKTG